MSKHFTILFKLQKEDRMATSELQDDSYTSRRNEGSKKGEEYEVVLMALFFERGNFEEYDFKLGYRLESAGKLDDIVFKYTDGNKVKYRYFQLKHRFKTTEKITADILQANEEQKKQKNPKKQRKTEYIYLDNMHEEPKKRILAKYFNLQQYFRSFCEIESNLKSDLNNELQDIIIFTTVDLDCVNLKENGITTIKITEPDDILGPDFQDSQRFKIKVNQRNHELYRKLKRTSDSILLASQLVKFCLDDNLKDKEISNNIPIFEKYQIPLCDKVLNKEVPSKKGKFRDNFIKNEGLSENVENFRKLFEDEGLRYLKLTRTDKNVKRFWETIEERELIFLKYFGNESQTSLPRNLPQDKISVVKIDKFFEHLVLAVKQPNVTQVLEIIKPELKDSWEFDFDLNFVRNVYVDSVRAWIQGNEQKDEKGFISGQKAKNFFTSLKEHEALSNAKYLNNYHTEKLKNFQIEFVSFSDLEEFMGKDYQILHIKAPEKDSVLSSIKVYQYLRDNQNDSFFFTSQDHISHLPVITDIFMKYKDIVVIDCKEDLSETIDVELIDCLLDVVRENSNKKLILISSSDNQFCRKFAEKMKFPEKFIEENDKFSFKNISRDSQQKILDKKVIYQGAETKLSDIIEVNAGNMEILEKALNWKTVTQLLQNSNEIKIGQTIPNVKELCPYYIDRILTIQKTISAEKLKQAKNISDIFAVTGCISETQLRDFVGDDKNIFYFKDLQSNKDQKSFPNFVLIENSKDEFQKVWEMCAERKSAVHWIELKNGKIVWKESVGSLRYLRNFIDNAESEQMTFKENTFLKESDRNISIIAAESGMGKAKLIASLSEKAKQPSVWIIRVELNNFLEKKNDVCQQKKEVSSVKEAIDVLISSFLNLETELEEELFRYQCTQGKVVIFFDGYEELNYQNRVMIVKLMTVLNETNIKQWIVTQTHLKEELEDQHSLLSYSLQPFSKENQVNFLKDYWTIIFRKKGNIQEMEEKIQSSAEKLIELMYKSINGSPTKFPCIPLHVFMLADCFQKEIENWKEKGNFLQEKLDLLDLFDIFIKNKFYILKHKKGKIEKKSEVTDFAFELLESEFRKIHNKLAVKMLLPNKIKLLGKQETVFKKTTKVTPEMVPWLGIITNLDNNHNPHFIHRSFAEYFAANFFYKKVLKYIKDESIFGYIRETLQNHLFISQNIVMRKLFESMLARNSDLHVRILNYGSAIDFDDRNDWDLTQTDNGGRAPLHLAAAGGLQELLKKLLDNFLKEEGDLKKKAIVNMKDSLFKWSPLTYADRLNHWGCAELLLKYKAKKEDMVEAIQNIKSYFDESRGFYSDDEGNLYHKRTLLHFAAKKNFKKLMKVLVENGAELNAADKDSRTPLHCALFENNTDAAGYLINSNECDINAIEMKHGFTPLHIAVQQNNLKVVKCLLENPKIKTEMKDFKGATAVFQTAFNSDLAVLKYLLETKKFTVNDRDYSDFTLRDWAAKHTNIALQQYLNVEPNSDSSEISSRIY